MVTFTLTPTNANSIPHNIVHLIVAEGVTEIPEGLCIVGGYKGIKSLESVVFSKSVTIIRSEAFIHCINLKSVVFANDSQLTAIGKCAFFRCQALQSIIIPDSVTRIGDHAFSHCTNLESVLFSDHSCLQDIGDYAFYHCDSLQSIIIPKPVIELGDSVFCECFDLKSVIFADHATTQIVINGNTFSNCTSLQFITIPTTFTTMNEGTFDSCHILQVLDIPHQDAEADPYSFKNCPLLQGTLEKHGTDCMEGRFDALPIHQACYKLNGTTATNVVINYLRHIQDNDPALLQVDIMGMTPLHILCANPAANKDMVKQLYSKNTEAAAVRNVNYMLPWHMYVLSKDKTFCMFTENVDEDGRINVSMTDIAMTILNNDFDVDKLVDVDLNIDVVEIYLLLTGSSLHKWLETNNAVTGLYPFMSMVSLECHGLENVYEVAMMNLTNIFQRRTPSQNTKCTNRRNSTKRKRITGDETVGYNSYAASSYDIGANGGMSLSSANPAIYHYYCNNATTIQQQLSLPVVRPPHHCTSNIHQELLLELEKRRLKLNISTTLQMLEQFQNELDRLMSK